MFLDWSILLILILIFILLLILYFYFYSSSKNNRHQIRNQNTNRDINRNINTNQNRKSFFQSYQPLTVYHSEQDQHMTQKYKQRLFKTSSGQFKLFFVDHNNLPIHIRE